MKTNNLPTGEWSQSEGMTLRDHFAGLAMQGFAADPNVVGTTDDIATCAYQWADAMLKARELSVQGVTHD